MQTETLEQVVETMANQRATAQAFKPGPQQRLAFADYYAMKEPGKQAFAQRYGAKVRRHRLSLPELAAGETSRHHIPYPCDSFGFFDHQTSYLLNGKPWAHVVHTYADMEVIAGFAITLRELYGLCCYLPPTPSWYNPMDDEGAGTVPVIIARLDDDVGEDWSVMLASIM